MKYITVLWLLLISVFALQAQPGKDLFSIRSLKQLSVWRDSLNATHNTGDFNPGYAQLSQALWNGIPVHEVRFENNELKMEVLAKTPGGAKRMIQVVQEQYGDVVKKKEAWSGTVYSANTPEINIELSVDADKDKPLTANTGAELTMSFKPVYEEPYPNIAKKIIPQPNGMFYFLSLDYYENNVQVYLNDICIYNALGRSRHINEREINLNPFILGRENIKLKVLITPGHDEKGQPYASIQKSSFATAELRKGFFKNEVFELVEAREVCKFKEYVTDTINDGEVRYSSYTGTSQYGGRQLSAAYDFIVDVSYQTDGWANGKDLRQDKNLKQKVTALYEKLAKIIEARDAAALSAIMYGAGKEDAEANYNQKAALITDRWTQWMDMLAKTNVVKIEKDFDLEISGDGKLIYAIPRNQKDMLRAIGKNTVTGFTLYMFEDKNDDQLKFIR
ncbi:hypothetical protein U0035_19470 [Niabella yanshanensis]|uniref:Uncharacterized protein n=1 Tax=Niabella yanshanensis TaxID=577386 RepID=A0ABZ0W3K5_9BACT|nr:hypothetical protein [Niabella yanshanensis]WQD37850.1 hypothetical protein U0035_19470 [Niabella yanshanensis]